jgi:hypothetical protein
VSLQAVMFRADPGDHSRMLVVVGCAAPSAAVKRAPVRGPTGVAMSGTQPNLGAAIRLPCTQVDNHAGHTRI